MQKACKDAIRSGGQWKSTLQGTRCFTCPARSPQPCKVVLQTSLVTLQPGWLWSPGLNSPLNSHLSASPQHFTRKCEGRWQDAWSSVTRGISVFHTGLIFRTLYPFLFYKDDWCKSIVTGLENDNYLQSVLRSAKKDLKNKACHFQGIWLVYWHCTALLSSTAQLQFPS